MADEGSLPADLVTICVVHGLLRAQVVKAKLEQAGISVLLSYESVGPIIGIIADGLAEVQIRVLSRYADEARALINEQESL